MNEEIAPLIVVIPFLLLFLFGKFLLWIWDRIDRKKEIDKPTDDFDIFARFRDFSKKLIEKTRFESEIAELENQQKIQLNSMKEIENLVESYDFTDETPVLGGELKPVLTEMEILDNAFKSWNDNKKV